MGLSFIHKKSRKGSLIFRIIPKSTNLRQAFTLKHKSKLAAHTKLSDLNKGQPATVLAIKDDELSIKLLEMGLLPGERVVLEHVAPFGDPIAISVGEYQMCLRLSDAQKINVVIQSATN